jgi:hypothetical protein
MSQVETIKPRKITSQELCDLPQSWNNPTVDTSLYYQSCTQAWEVDKEKYDEINAKGFLCQIVDGRYYVGVCEDALDLV